MLTDGRPGARAVLVDLGLHRQLEAKAASCPMSPVHPQAWTAQEQHAALGYEQHGLPQQQKDPAHPAAPMEIPQHAASTPCTAAGLRELQTSKTAPGDLQGISALRVLLGNDSMDDASSSGSSESQHSLDSPGEAGFVHSSSRDGSKGSMDSCISTISSMSSVRSEDDAAAGLHEQQASQEQVRVRKVTWGAKGFLGKSLSFSARSRQGGQAGSCGSASRAGLKETSALGQEAPKSNKLAKLKAAATGVCRGGYLLYQSERVHE